MRLPTPRLLLALAPFLAACEGSVFTDPGADRTLTIDDTTFTVHMPARYGEPRALSPWSLQWFPDDMHAQPQITFTVMPSDQMAPDIDLIRTANPQDELPVPGHTVLVGSGNGSNIQLDAWSALDATHVVRCEIVVWGGHEGLPAEVEARRAWAQQVCLSPHL